MKFIEVRMLRLRTHILADKEFSASSRNDEAVASVPYRAGGSSHDK